MNGSAETLVFDLDNTLYDRRIGVVDRIDERINAFMTERLGVPSGEVDSLRRRHWQDHGTTLRGLTHSHRVDPDEYLEFVHDIDLGELLAPDPRLAGLLRSLPQRKAVFSNASRLHAARVLEHLGVAPHFDAVVCLEDLDYVPKPIREAYDRLLDFLDADPRDCSFVEDTVKNLGPAKALGMRTIWVTPEPSSTLEASAADHVVESVYDLGSLLA